MAWSYREATEADVPRMYVLYQAHLGTNWYCAPNLAVLGIEGVRRFVTGKHLHTTVLEQDGMVVGYVTMWEPTEPKDEAHADAFVLDLTVFDTPLKQEEAVQRLLAVMWRSSFLRSRFKVIGYLDFDQSEAVRLVRKNPLIAASMAIGNKKSTPVDALEGLHWAESIGY